MRSSLTMAAMAASAGLWLSGCAAQQADQQRQAMIAAVGQQHQADAAACKATFSESNKDAIAREKCLSEADNKSNPFTKYPDLANLLTAKRTELAEKQAAGKITRAEMVLEFNELAAKVGSEAQRRDNDARAVAAQQQANNTATALLLMQSMRANQPAPAYQVPAPTFTPPPRTLNTNCWTVGTNTTCQTQ